MNSRLIKYLFFTLLLGMTWNTQAQLLPDFVDETLNSSLTKPVGITFDQIGNAYIWEQSGLVHIMDTTGAILSSPLIDIREEVSEFVDHGLLGFALDPQFAENGFIYLLYVVDPHHLFNFGTPNYDPNTTNINEATIGRITRYTADPDNDFKTVIPASRKILLGQNETNGFPIVASSHGVGTLTFGTDGTLIVSCGETGSFVSSDAGDHPDSFFEEALASGIIRPAENVGAFRSQILNSLNGKILRLDPETGYGVPSNPYYDAQNPEAPKSKVWLRGLRNPFRIYLDPSTGSHNAEDADPGVIYIGDVGAGHWEELNIAPEGGLNFGWPIYEGMVRKNSFTNKIRLNLDAPNLNFGTDTCSIEYYTFHDLITQPNSQIPAEFLDDCIPPNTIPQEYIPSVHVRPIISWLNHNRMTDSVAIVPGFDENGNAIEFEIESPEAQVEGVHFEGSSSIAGFHYEGDNFPEEFHGRYFHADFKGWISIFEFGDDYKLTRVDTFASDIKGIVDLKVSPKDGCIYFIKAINGPSVHRICYGGDPLPVAVAEADVYYGTSPLSVTLDASSSYHPKDYPFTVEWKLPNGDTSNEMIYTHVFETNDANPTAFNVELIVTDSVDNTDTKELIISLNNTPPIVEITSVQDGDLYPLSDFTNLPLRANVSDNEHENSELSYAWQAFLFHNNHNHAGPIINESEGFALIEPVGCTDETYWYKIELTVTDVAGLSTKDVVEIFPDCGTPFGEDITLSGIPLEDFVQLTWITNNEQDIKEYEIQRSLNNTDFITIGIVTNENLGTYIYDDRMPNWGPNRYRIKAVKESGIYDYSNKISLEYPGDQDFTVFPNPTEDILNIEVLTSNGQIEFNLFDASGKLVLIEKWLDDVQDGIATPISIKDLANGVYYYKIRNGISTFEGSVVKMN